MDRRVRQTLIEMNRVPERKQKYKTESLQRSHAKLSNTIKEGLKVKKVCGKAKKCVPEIKVTPSCVRGFFRELFPFWDIMRGYSLRRFLLKDFVAGITVGIIHIPQGKVSGVSNIYVFCHRLRWRFLRIEGVFEQLNAHKETRELSIK